MVTDLTGVGYQVPTPTYNPLYETDVYPATLTGTPLLDILVPTYGKLQLTIDCINSIYGYTASPFHLIILNADCADDFGLTHQWALEFIKSHQNITYCHRKKNWKEGNQFFNLGLTLCKTEYVITCMNSITVRPYWEKPALEVMRNNPLIGTIGFKCLFPNGLIESAGIIFNGIIPSDYGRDDPGYDHNEIVEMPACQWAFAMHRKQALVGNLPEDVFNGHVGWDDIDNCMCVKAKGWKIFYCGQGVGIHKPRATRGDNSTEAFLKNQQNSHRFWKRWGMWDKYLEGIKMDVKDLMKPETKNILSNCVTEYQVLTHLLQVCNKSMQDLSNEAMRELGVDVEKYILEMNPATNTWVLRNRVQPEAPKVIETTIGPALPAGDTKHDEPVPEKVNADIRI